MTRSLSSPKSVVRTQTAPSSSKTCPCARSRSTASSTRLGSPSNRARAACARRTTRRSARGTSSSEACSSPSWKSYARSRAAVTCVLGVAARGGRAALRRTRRASSSMYDAGVAVLGRRLALGRGEHRAAEPLHLGAGVVDVELAGDRRRRWPSSRRAIESPSAAQRVCPMCSGPVGFALTNSTLIVLPRWRLVRAEARRRPRRSSWRARRRPRHPVGC